MAVNTQEFKIKISVEDNVSAPIAHVKAAAESSASSFEKIGGGAVVLNQGLELVKKAYEFLAEPIHKAIDAFVEQDKSVNKLTATLSVLGQNTPGHVKGFVEFAESMEKATNTSSELILNMVSMAKATGRSDDQTKQLITTAADLAAVTGGDLNESFRQLLAQYDGIQARSIRGIGDTKQFTTAQLQAGAGVQFLSEKLHGLAEQSLGSIAGKMGSAKVATEDMYKALGELITKTLDYSAMLDRQRGNIDKVTKVIKDLTPTVIEVGNAFRAVDWAKIAIDIAVVTVAAIALKSAMEFSAAIKAIGGVTKAIEAMGGMAGMLAQIRTFFTGLRVAALSTLGPMLSMASTIAAFVLAAAAIEIVLRNLDKLDQILFIIESSAHVVGNVLSLAFAKTEQMVGKAIGALVEFLNKAGVVGDEQLARSKKAAEESAKGIANILKDMDTNIDKVKQNAKGIDFGASGEIAKLVSGLFAANEKTGEIVESGNEWAKTQKEVISNMQEQIRLLAQIEDQNAGIANDIANVGASQEQQIKNNLALEIKRLDNAQKLLQEENKLNGPEGIIIKAALEQQRNLMNKKAVVEIAQLEKQRNLELMQASHETDTMATTLANIGATQEDQLKNNLALEMKVLDIKLKQAEVAGKLIGKDGERLKAEIEKQRGLAVDVAGKKQKELDNPNPIGPDAVKTLSDAFGEGAGQFAKQIGAVTGGITEVTSAIGGVMGSISGVLDFAQQIIDFIPQILDKISGIFESLTDLPNKILAGVNRLMQSIIKLITDFIPNIIKDLPKIIKNIVTGIMDAIPAAIKQLMASIPDLIQGFLDELPSIVKDFVAGIISAMPDMVLAFVRVIIEHGPQIAMSILQMFYIELPKAIINGIIEGAKRIIKMFGDFFSGGSVKAPAAITNLPGTLNKAVTDFGNGIAKSASQIFQVKDLDSAFKLPTTKSVTDPLADLSKKFDGIWALLKKAWQWVWDHIIQPLIDGLTAVWRWVYDKIVEPIIDGLTAIWHFVYDYIVGPLIDGLTNIWRFVYDNVVRPLVTGLTNVWNFVAGVLGGFISAITGAFHAIVNLLAPIVTGLSNFFSSAWSIGSNIFNGFWNGVISVWSQLYEWGREIYHGFWNAISSVWDQFYEWGRNIYHGLWNGIMNVWDQLYEWGREIYHGFWNGIVSIWDQFTNLGRNIAAGLWNAIIKFNWGGLVGGGGGGGGNGGTLGQITGGYLATGGSVTNYFADGGLLGSANRVNTIYASNGVFTPRGTDTVPAMLTPGEFVVTAGATNGNLDALKSLNQTGKLPGGGGGITINNLTINASSAMDAEKIRREVVPVILNEIKRETQNGRFVIAKEGIR
jgi:phage-related protein